MSSGFASQLHPSILNKSWFFSCDRNGGLNNKVFNPPLLSYESETT
ncbi:MAG: hypothetical protein V7K42_17850 [Nostoc sp.]